MPPIIPSLTAQPYARKPRNINLTTGSYTLTADDDGAQLTNVGATGNVQFIVPAGLPRPFSFRARQASASFDLQVKFSGVERLRNSGSTTTAAGTATFTGAGAATVGYAMEIERVDGPNGNYGVVNAIGAPTLA